MEDGEMEEGGGKRKIHYSESHSVCCLAKKKGLIVCWLPLVRGPNEASGGVLLCGTHGILLSAAFIRSPFPSFPSASPLHTSLEAIISPM